MKAVVVTGASTGIGWATCKVLLDRGFRVFGSVRTQADADRLRTEFAGSFTPLVCDVTDEAAVRAAAADVRAALGQERLCGLVSNAGIAVAGPIVELPIADLRRQMEVNVVGPVIVMQAFASLLGANRALKGRAGRIVMMGSVSGRVGTPFLAPYCSSKFALEGLTESMRRELMLFGIDVILIGPGPIKTSIWNKSRDSDMAMYRNSPFYPALERFREMVRKAGTAGLPAAAVAELVHHVLTASRPKVRYTITPNRVESLLAGILPKRLIDNALAKRLGLMPTENGF